MSKSRIIHGIKNIVKQYGGVLTTKDLDMETPPLYKSLGDDHQELVERFFPDEVEVTTYAYDEQTTKTLMPYENLEYDTLEEIMVEMEIYVMMKENHGYVDQDDDWN
jgi:hypothetical protein